MIVGNFIPFLGTLGDDPIENSQNGFFAESNGNLQANSLDIVYGLAGNDSLSTDPDNSDFDSDDVAVLVGGEGSDQYLMRNNSTVVIFDNGNSGNDIISASIISSVTDSFLTIDNERHLYVLNEATDTYVLLPNYRDPANQIESFNTLNGGMLSYADLILEVDDAISDDESGYLGDFTFAELEDGNDSNIPDAARLDLDSIGLSADEIDSSLQTIADTANNFENTIASTDENIDGDLDGDDNSYTYENNEYLFDLYSLDQSVFNSGDIANITLTSEDFNPLLFVLDSRGNVVEFDGDASDNSSELSFIVGSGEPLFIAVESRNSEGMGEYDIAFDQVEADISGVDFNETNTDEVSLFGIDTIQATDTLNGSITTEDLQNPDTSDVFYQDRVLLVNGESVGDELTVEVESMDFDALLTVSSIDADGNTSVLNGSNGVSETTLTFTIEADLDYLFTVDTSNTGVTGDYTLTTTTTELI